MKLPPIFITTIKNAFGERGRDFLENLPALIDEASQRWGLSEIQPVGDLSYNFVAYAVRASTSLPIGRFAPQENCGTLQREEVILKIGVPDRELTSEMTALRLFNGEGAVRLIDADETHGMSLLERLRPGIMLSTLEDDGQATNIAADVMLKLWRPLSLESDGLLSKLHEQALALQNRFIKLTDWFDGLKKLRPMFGGGTGPFPKGLVARVEETLPRLYAESSPPCLIHGDLHHFNILSAERGTTPPGWLAIDPKGVIGHPEYEVGPLLINPAPDFLNGASPTVQTERRIAILSERLGFPRQRLKDWALCHAVLSAWWDTKPDATGGEYSMRCAELFASL